MESATHSTSTPLRQHFLGSAAESQTEMTAPRGNESHDNSQPRKIQFRGGGILLRPIPFYVKNNEPTLQEFEIF
jgi:hypothetical protein